MTEAVGEEYPSHNTEEPEEVPWQWDVLERETLSPKEEVGAHDLVLARSLSNAALKTIQP